jgi:hypothetical protein
VAIVVGLTVVAGALHLYGQGSPPAGVREPSPLITLLGMLSLLLVFGIFNYTESSGTRSLGGFPRRLFVLPVPSWQLVAVPTLTGVVSIELWYLAWMEPLSPDASTSRLFIGVLLAALMVFYQTALWTLERVGVLRLVIAGAIGVVVFGVGLLPTLPPTPPPVWRSEIALALVVGALATVAFLVSWNHVRILRSGGRATRPSLAGLLGRLAEALPGRRTPFASADAAQFWFEWRTSGIVLPALVAGVLLVFITPLSLVLGTGGDTLRLVLATLLTPVILAIPVGMAFSKPTFSSDDLSLPAFIATRPVAADAIVATKIKVALFSAALSWVLVLAFLFIWLPTWANRDGLGRLAMQWWAFHAQSVWAVYGTAALVVMAGWFLTWRSLVSRLWSGLYGSRTIFVASVALMVVAVIAAMAFDADRFPGWMFKHPSRLTPVLWIAAAAVIAKYWLAAYVWRRVPARYLRAYLLVWFPGTLSVVALALVLWNVSRIYVPMDVYQFQGLLMMLALLALPLVRVGLTPACLSHNRHRRA